MPASSSIIAFCILVFWVGAIIGLERRVTQRLTLKTLLYPGILGLYIALWTLPNLPSGLTSMFRLHQQFVALIGIFLCSVWLISVIKKDTSIMDIAYPLTAAVPVWVLLSREQSWTPHAIMVCLFVTIWALRLAGHLAVRNLPNGEDARYAAWRKRYGSHWWWWSAFQIFALQGVLVSLWCIPLILSIDASPAGLSAYHAIAAVLFSVGLYFQAVSDYQLEAFRKTRSSASEVLNTGLWSLSRHPNYFGECLVWWSFGALGMAHELGFLGLLAPIYVTWFMSKGSAAPMQERYLHKKKPEYASYIRDVPAFFPKFKR